MEIKSSLLNDEDFIHVKNSLIEISEKDHKEDFRVKMVEYINDSSYDEDDLFFYDMLEFIRFLDPSTDAVAYTSDRRLIYLNAPGTIGENLRYWDFIYDHECLHQLWETFKIAEKIKKEGKEYNHYLLNVASDCVINDYLSYIRKKSIPDNLITPKYLESEYGVKYDRKYDTQYSLYLKLIDCPKKKELEEYAKEQEKIHNGKITPKEIKDAEENGSSGGGPSEKHSDDYKKGWIDAINDVLDKKVDPSKFRHKPSTNDYNKGYNDAIDQIKQGQEEGISQSKDSKGGGKSDLPQIPWDAPSMQKNGNSGDSNSNQLPSEEDIKDMTSKEAAKSAQKSADKAKDAADKAQAAADKAQENGSKDANAKKYAANKSKEAAQAAQDAADKAKEAAKKDDVEEARNQANKAASKASEAFEEANKAIGNSNDPYSDIDDMSADEAADAAAKAADEAADATEQAKSNAQKARDAGCDNADDLEDAAKKAQEAAKAAQDAAKKSKEASNNGDTKDAQNAAKEAAQHADDAKDQSNKQQGKPNGGWSGNKHLQEIVDDEEGKKVDIDEIAKKAEAKVKKWQERISGDIGQFVRKCVKSAELNPDGLVVKVDKGASLWNSKMQTYMSTFVKQKIFSKHRQYQRTYKRIKRGSGIVKYGEPLQKGKKIRNDKLTINVAFYVDISGSMYNCIEHVFKAAYQISEAIKNKFGRDQVVDDVVFKMFVFNTQIKEIKWGTTVPARGDNVEFSDIVKYMSTHTKEYMINVVITDARFTIGKNQVKTFIKDIDGMLLFITNCESKDMEELSKEFKTQIFYILADKDFTIDNKK